MNALALIAASGEKMNEEFSYVLLLPLLETRFA